MLVSKGKYQQQQLTYVLSAPSVSSRLTHESCGMIIARISQIFNSLVEKVSSVEISSEKYFNIILSESGSELVFAGCQNRKM